MTVTDEELVARSVAGDTDSFNQLILRWERPIYALAYRQIGREDDARDVVQEAFLRAFRALPGFKGQAKFSSWLYRITLNLCRDWMRRERRAPFVQAPEGVDVDDLVGSEPSRAESIEDRRHAQGPEPARGERDAGASGGTAVRDHPEGVPRADVPGDCRAAGLPVEHGEDAPLPGALRAAARARAARRGAGEARRQWTAMNETRFCGNPDVLMSYLYDEGDEHERRAFEAHLRTCEACAREVADLRSVRGDLAAWAPPEAVLDFRIVREPAPTRRFAWLAVPELPVWAQFAAATLVVGIAVGISGLEVSYNPADGLKRARGLEQAGARAPPAPAAPVQAAAAPGGEAPWKADLVALREQLRVGAAAAGRPRRRRRRPTAACSAPRTPRR